MARKLKPAQSYQARAVVDARSLLAQALRSASVANCPALMRKIESAIKSADGARRHMQRRLDATEKAMAADLATINMATMAGCRFHADASWSHDDKPWSWMYGSRSSIDQHCLSFATKVEAARHFLSVDEGKRATKHAKACQSS